MWLNNKGRVDLVGTSALDNLAAWVVNDEVNEMKMNEN